MNRAEEGFLRALADGGFAVEVTEFPAGTRTAQDAARAIGTSVDRIAKSVVFHVGDEYWVVVLSGDHVVDEKALAELSGATVRRATPDEVLENAGCPIGGTPPLGHAVPMRILIDESVFAHETVWVAAGAPTKVAPVATRDLARISRGSRVAVGRRK